MQWEHCSAPDEEARGKVKLKDVHYNGALGTVLPFLFFIYLYFLKFYCNRQILLLQQEKIFL